MGIWAVLAIAVIGSVMLGMNFAEAQKAVATTLDSLACTNGETVKFQGNGWKCMKIKDMKMKSMQLKTLADLPQNCNANNIGELYIKDNPQFDAVCVCAEYAGTPQFVELTGTGTC